MEYKHSDGFNRIISQSRSEARRLRSEFVNTEHLLLGMIKTENSAKVLLEQMNADLTQIRRKIELLNDNVSPLAEGASSISLTTMANQAIKRSHLECRQYHATEIDPIHLLLGILFKQEDPTTNILLAYDIDYDRVTEEYRAMLGGFNKNSPK